MTGSPGQACHPASIRMPPASTRNLVAQLWEPRGL
jgi:hypothetical protein